VSPRERAPAGALRVALETLVVFAVMLAYLALFRTYGFDIVDEGTQLAQVDRVAHGARPYLDFETGYTPWYFALHVALWRLTGTELLATRTFGVVLHATTVALLFAALRRRASAVLAGSVVLLDVAFLLPIAPRAGAPFNVPYPGWITATLALAAQLLVAGVAAARVGGAGIGAFAVGVLPLLAAGTLAGVAAAVKPNAGLLALGGVVLATVAGWRRGDVVASLLGAIVRLGAVVGAVLLLGATARDPAYVVALLLPVVIAALRGGPLASASVARPMRDLLAIAAGFLLPTAIWALPLLRELGAGRFAREVLLLDGGGVLAAYLLPLPAPGVAAAGLCVAALIALVLLRSTRDAVVTQGASSAAAVVLLAGVAFATATAGAQGARIVGEEVCLWLGPLALGAALLLVPRSADTARVQALLAFAATYALQLFPRPDLIHVAMGGPPLLLALGAAWGWLSGVTPGRDGRGRLGLVARAAIALLVAICMARALPGLRARLIEPQVALDAGPRAPLTIGAPWAAEHAWLGEAVRAIDARTAAGEDVFTFPDLGGLAFLADRPNPFFYLYFVPGRPDLAGEQRTIAELEQRRPRIVLTGHPRVPAFADAESYFARLGAYLDERYPAAETLSGCTLRVRADER
jgi:hypothetical protein